MSKKFSALRSAAILAFVILPVALASAITYLGLHEDPGPAIRAGTPNDAALAARGAYLARAGDCIACHTSRGGAAYAGGRAIQTPFGTIYSPNITPDKDTGIGRWNADDFWRALHNGKSKDGRLLYPAFPYPDYTRITRADADAMFAYFKSIKPVSLPSKEPELAFPYNLRALLVVWRALYFRPGVYSDMPQQGVSWNRGAYLVQGLGHCGTCHSAHNALGAATTRARLGGETIPMLDWYAPELAAGAGMNLEGWSVPQVSALLKTGISERGAVSGPMAEVVRESLQYLSDEDVQAMGVYLKTLQPSGASPQAGTPAELSAADQESLRIGAAIYDKHCAGCHKPAGQGAPPAFPALAGNHSVTAESPVNPIRIVLLGGYPPSTGGNPRPYGMPPFAPVLADADVAAVVSYIRNSWGNHGSIVDAAQVNAHRAVPVE